MLTDLLDMLVAQEVHGQRPPSVETEAAMPLGSESALIRLRSDLCALPPPASSSLYALAPHLLSGHTVEMPAWPSSLEGRGSPPTGKDSRQRAPGFHAAGHKRDVRRPTGLVRAATARDLALRFCHELTVAGAGPRTRLEMSRLGEDGDVQELAIGLSVVHPITCNGSGSSAISASGKGGSSLERTTAGGAQGSRGKRLPGRGARGDARNSVNCDLPNAAQASPYRSLADWRSMVDQLSERLLGHSGRASLPLHPLHPASLEASTGCDPSTLSAMGKIGHGYPSPPKLEPRLSAKRLSRLLDADMLFSASACASALTRTK